MGARHRIYQCRPTRKRRFDNEKKQFVTEIIQGDNLKAIQQDTYVCMICKEFSKGRTTCPICNRKMISFGSRVRKVKKGSKTKWRAFIKAKAGYIYKYAQELMPDEEVKQQIAALYVKLNKARLFEGREHREKIDDLKREYVVKFDKYLDKHKRGK